MIKHLDNENMEDIINNGLWIVDFYADWCGPCKMLGPILEGLEQNILKINVDEHEDLAQKFGIMSIPTLIFFQNGEMKNKVIGFRNKEEILKIIEEIK